MRLFRPAILTLAAFGALGCASAAGGGGHTTLAPAREFVEVDNNSAAEVVVRFASRAERENGGYLGVVEPNHRATFELPSREGQVLLQRRNGTDYPSNRHNGIYVRRFRLPATSDVQPSRGRE
jgi:hypothetical protein